MEGEQLDEWNRAFGNMPKTKKKQSGTNELTDFVMETMRDEYNCAVARINTQGTYNEELGRYIFSGATKGVEDVNCVYPIIAGGIKIGLTVAVEVKFGKDSQSDHQIKRMNNVRAAGGVYMIAKTKEQFLEDIKKILSAYNADN